MAIEAGTSTYYQAKRGIVQDGLVLHLDAGVKESYSGGTVWYDLSRNGNDATLANGPSLNKNKGGSINFDGLNDYGVSYFDISNTSLTIEIIFQIFPTTATWRDLLVLDDNTNSIVLEIGANNGSENTNGYLRYYGANTGMSSNDLASPGQYSRDYKIHYAVLTLNSEYGKSYFDGQLQGISDFTGSPVTYNRLSLGNDLMRAGYPRYCQSNIYQARIYNKVLSADEVSRNYNATRHRFGL